MNQRKIIKNQIKMCRGKILININDIIIRISKTAGYEMFDVDNISDKKCEKISSVSINTDLYIIFN